MELNGVMLAGSMFVRPSVRPSRNVGLCTAKKQLDLEASIFAHVWMLTKYVRKLSS